jgi:hypothetical protein
MPAAMSAALLLAACDVGPLADRSQDVSAGAPVETVTALEIDVDDQVVGATPSEPHGGTK